MIATTARERKRIPLKEMLRWAYNRQQVDSLTGKTLDNAKDELFPFTPGYSADGTAQILARGELGTAIDCAGSNRFARNDVHPDAEALHDIVLELGPIDARLVVDFGHTGRFPEPMTAIPRPRPFMQHVISGGGGDARRRREVPGLAKRLGRDLAADAIESWEAQPGDKRPMPPDRCGYGMVQGHRELISIAVAEIIRERVPQYIYAGRGKMKLSHYDEVITEVEYCPLEWWPDLAYVAAVNGIAEHWDRVIVKLLERLSGARFVEHEIEEML